MQLATTVVSKAGQVQKAGQLAGVFGSGATPVNAVYSTAGAMPWQAAGAVANPAVAASGNAAVALPWQVPGPPMPAGAAAGGAGALGTSIAGIAGYWGGTKLAEALGQNPTGGGIGGGLGSTAGFILSGGNPLGAVVGGALGSLVGGMFGNNEPSDFTQAGGININTQQVVDRYAKEESSTGKKFNSNVAALRDNVQQGANTFTKWLIDNGATPKEDPSGKQKDMLFIIGGRDGFRTAMMDNGWDKSVRVEEKNLSGYKNYGKDYKAYSNGIADQLLSNFNVDDNVRAKFEEMKKNGELDDIAAFGSSKEQYSQTYSQDLIKSTQRDTLIAAPKTPNTKWRDFITTYNSKYEANRA